VFAADLDAGELHKSGVRQKLSGQPFEVLRVLLQHPGQIVSRQELQRSIWPDDTFVDYDLALRKSITRLREILGDSADNPRFIETIPRKGYRFIAPVISSDQGLLEPIDGSQRTPFPSRLKIALAIAVVALSAVTVAGLLWRSQHARKLTDRDTIVLADFVNTTGDSVFDDALKQGVRVQLEQSPFLSILSERRVSDELLLMGRAQDDRLTRAAADEICQRTGGAAVLAGTISNLGSHYVIGLNASNCRTGENLSSVQIESDSREHVLRGLGASVTSMREKLGESLSTIAKYNVPLEEASTPSLEALQAYSLGMKTWRSKGGGESIPFFDRAIELDHGFALACTDLADIYEDLGEPGLAGEYASKAYQFRDRGNPREKFRIATAYYFHQTGDLRKAIETAELWAQSYPRDSWPPHYESVINEFLGRYEKAVADGLEALRLDPDAPNLHSDLMEDYLALDRRPQVRTVYQQALERRIDNVFLHNDMYVLAFLEDDRAEMAREVAWASGKPAAQDLLLSAQSDTEAFFGRLVKARQLSRRAFELAASTGQKETAALWELDDALHEAELGNSVQARQRTRDALATASTRDVQILAALVLARAGDSTQAQRLCEKLEKRLPYNMELNSYWLPSIRAAIQLNLGSPSRALELLEIAKPYELAFPRPQIGGGGLLYPVWLRGLALLRQNRGNEAAAEFRKILEHRSIITNSLIGAIAHVQLARSYFAQGDKSQARTTYQDFFALWKDADPDIPILKEAKAEYANLQ